MRIIILAVIIAIVIMSIVAGTYIFIDERSLQENIAIKNKEFEASVSREREVIKRDLDEKYRADMTSFQVMARRLEYEKQRSRELEEKLKASTGKKMKK